MNPLNKATKIDRISYICTLPSRSKYNFVAGPLDQK